MPFVAMDVVKAGATEEPHPSTQRSGWSWPDIVHTSGPKRVNGQELQAYDSAMEAAVGAGG